MPDRGELAWASRLTIAASASYIVARVLFEHGSSLLAPLTALLVVQLTPVSLLARGLDRVLSVTAGVLVAVGLLTADRADLVEPRDRDRTVAVVAQALRLGPNLLRCRSARCSCWAPALAACRLRGADRRDSGGRRRRRRREPGVPTAPRAPGRGSRHRGLADDLAASWSRPADDIESLIGDGRPAGRPGSGIGWTRLAG